jgi:hypothetical protein
MTLPMVEDSPDLAPAAVVALWVHAVGTDTAEGNLVLDLDAAAAPQWLMLIKRSRITLSLSLPLLLWRRRGCLLLLRRTTTLTHFITTILRVL